MELEFSRSSIFSCISAVFFRSLSKSSLKKRRVQNTSPDWNGQAFISSVNENEILDPNSAKKALTVHESVVVEILKGNLRPISSTRTAEYWRVFLTSTPAADEGSASSSIDLTGEKPSKGPVECCLHFLQENSPQRVSFHRKPTFAPRGSCKIRNRNTRVVPCDGAITEKLIQQFHSFSTLSAKR